MMYYSTGMQHAKQHTLYYFPNKVHSQGLKETP